MPKVFVVIVNYNGEQYWEELFRSLQLVQPKTCAMEIIVVDNSATEKSINYFKTIKSLHFLPQTHNTGFAGGNNTGMKYALDHGADYIYLLNQDTVVEPNFLDPIVSMVEVNRNVGAAQSLLLLWPEKSGTETKINSWGNELHFLGFGFVGGLGHSLIEAPTKPKEITYASGAAVLYRASALKEVGLFDESYFLYHEDTDLSLKLRLQKYAIMLVPASHVFHKYKFGNSKSTYFYLERNRFRLLLEFYKWPTLLLLVPAFLAMECGVMTFSFISGFWKQRLAAYFWLFKNIKMVMTKRKNIQAKRLILDKELCQHLTGEIDFQAINNAALRKIANPIFSAYWFVIKTLIQW